VLRHHCGTLFIDVSSKPLWTTRARSGAGRGSRPDDPRVIAALDLVRWELSLYPLQVG
jgi:hypothetical protein